MLFKETILSKEVEKERNLSSVNVLIQWICEIKIDKRKIFGIKNKLSGKGRDSFVTQRGDLCT